MRCTRMCSELTSACALPRSYQHGTLATVELRMPHVAPFAYVVAGAARELSINHPAGGLARHSASA